MSISRGPNHFFDTNGTFVQHSSIVIYTTLASDMHRTNIPTVINLEFSIIHNTFDHHNHPIFHFYWTSSLFNSSVPMLIKRTLDRSTRNTLFLSRNLIYFLVPPTRSTIVAASRMSFFYQHKSASNTIVNALFYFIFQFIWIPSIESVLLAPNTLHLFIENLHVFQIK